MAVDRDNFAIEVTKLIKDNSKIEIIHEEVTKIPKQGIIIIATGPLTSEIFSKEILRKVGEEELYFYGSYNSSSSSINILHI